MSRRGHNEGTIRQRGKRWEARLTLGYGPDGRQQRRSFYGTTRLEAQQKLTKALRDLQQGVPPANEKQTVTYFLNRWLKECHKQRVRPSTYTRSTQVIKDHILPRIGRIRLAKLTPQDVQGMLNDLHASGLSPKSVQNIQGVLRSALNQAVRWGDLQRNVATLVSPPRGVVKEIEPFNPEEAVKFLEAIKGDRLEALYSVVLALGLRRGEALGLQWPDVNLDDGFLTIRHALQRQQGGLKLVEPKTVRGRRTIALPEFAVTALRNHRKRQLEERMLAGKQWQDSGHVFTTSIGTPLDPDNVTHYFKRIVAKAGLRPQRFHDLRHACASLLLAQGVAARVVQEILGHSHVSTTLGIYSHVIPALRRDAADRMNSLLAPRDPQTAKEVEPGTGTED